MSGRVNLTVHALVALTLTVLFAAGSMCILLTLYKDAAQRAVALQETLDRRTLRLPRPPVDECPGDVELWECIRHALYRRDL